MKSSIIKLPSGEAIKASAIVAIRKGDAEVSNKGTSSEYQHKERVIINFGTEINANCIVEDCDSRELRDILAARVISEWEDAVNT